MKKFLVSTMLALLLGGLVVQTASAGTLTLWVNDDAGAYARPGQSCRVAGYATIQGAINAAPAGSLIYVCPGTYVENVLVNKNDLTIRSVEGASVTRVHAAVSFHVFQVTATGLRLRGFWIVPAGTADGDIGVNIAVEGATGLRLRYNVIVGGRIGVNLGCGSFGSIVAYDRLYRQTEAGINVDTCEIQPFPGSHDNAIHHNLACSVTSTGSIALGGSSDDNNIYRNIVRTISVFGSGNHVHHNTTKLGIVDNGSGNNLHDNVVDPAVC